jgi:hypothetical protein
MAKFDIAGSMNGIMNDPSYQSVFLKTAAKKEEKKEEKCGKNCTCKDCKKEAKEKADALKAKEKEKADKIKAKEKADKEKAKAKAKKSGYEVCVQGLAKISEMLDDAGFDKAASYSLLALDSMIKKAQEVVDAGSANDMDLDEVIITPEDEIDLPEMTIGDKEDKTDAELLDELLGDTETEDNGFEFDFEPETDDSLNTNDMPEEVTASAVSSLEKMAADLRVILAKKKEEDKKGKDKKDDKKDKKDEKKNPFDKKNPFGNKKDDKKAPAKKDEKKDKKEDKQDAKKCKKAAWDFLA